MLISYRSFHNTDPPRIVTLWNECQLGRGAAQSISVDAFDLLVFAEPYFDKPGLIVACDGNNVVGYVHAGFGSNETGTALSYTAGVICIVLVRPEYRRQGIGRELVRRAEAYLMSKGATSLFAGESIPRNPFYLGMYGGSESVGFLESDPIAAPFFTSLGYVSDRRFVVYRRNISQKNEPFDPRLLAIRRKVQLSILSGPPNADWWWMTRQGRLDSVCFALQPTGGGVPIARITCWGMDLHSIMWRERTVGLLDLFVVESERRKAYAKALLLEVIRRLREEMVTHLEIAVPEDDVAATKLILAFGFERVDVGVVFRKSGM